jgi:Tol biopolymer transport system component
VSPDGSRIAYSSNQFGNLNIYVIDIRGSVPFRLTDAPSKDTDPAWFPDGSGIAFTRNLNGKTAIWKVGPMGGGATLLLDDARQPNISPDGSKIAFVRASPNGACRIGIILLRDPSNVKMLTDAAADTNAGYPAWSRDGRRICYVNRRELWIVDASGGLPRRITSDGVDKSEPAWSPDDSHIYFSSYKGGPQSLWRIAVNGGVTERLTSGTAEGHPSVSRDGRILVYATHEVKRQLVLLNRDSGEQKPLPGLQCWMPSISPDGSRIVFLSMRSNSDRNLWAQDVGGVNPSNSPQRLTEIDGVASHPAFSPDGQWIAYYRIFQNKRDIWIIPASGGSPTQFTQDSMSNQYPAWSPEGTMIAFASELGGSSQIWVAPVKDGKRAGKARQLTQGEFTAQEPSWSPDGANIGFAALRKERQEFWIVPSDGSAPPRQITEGANIQQLRWDRRTGEILVSGSWGEDKFSLHAVSPKNHLSRPFLPAIDFGGGGSAGFFDISADGKWLVFAREDVNGHIWLLKATGSSF